jgi:general secretion pathway protein G
MSTFSPRLEHPAPATVRRRSGLTLVELMLACAAVAVLAALALPTYSGYRDRARAADAATDIGGLAVMAKSYRAEYGRYPARLSQAIHDVVETDPWGSSYQYLPLENAPPSSTGQARKDKNLVPINSDFDLYSLGADGETQAPLAAQTSLDDIVRAADGAFIGLAEDY